MLVNPFECLSDSHEVFDQDSLITPSFAPVTQTFFEKDNLFEKKAKILSRLLPKTTNTVIIKNLKFNCDKMIISNLVSSFGEIYSLKHLNSRGMAIVTFYDSRSAESFIKGMDDKLFEQRRIKCDFLFIENSKNVNQLLYKCPSVILKSISTNNEEELSLSKEDIKSFFSEKYGEIRQVINCDFNTFILEFYDFRNAQKIIDDDENLIISQVPFQVSYAPDIIKNIDQIQNEQDYYHSKHDNYSINRDRY